MLWEFGTNSVHLRERKNGFLVSKRHRMKHLDFLSFLLESRVVSILGGTYGSREREISSNDVKRGDDCLQADFPLLIVVSERKITSVWPTICPEPWSPLFRVRHIHPSEICWKKCKCDTVGNPAAHWAIRSALEAVGALRCAGCNSERCVQLVGVRPEAQRFRITSRNPIPASMRAPMPGSGVVTTCFSKSDLKDLPALSVQVANQV
jgi:hypothetical protein